MPQTADHLLLARALHRVRADLFVLTRRAASATPPAIGIIGAGSSPVDRDPGNRR